MYILGISGLYHDSAAALIQDGNIVAAAQEERFTRRKHDPHIPQKAIEYVLKEADIKGEDIDAVIYYDQPFLTLNRFLSNAVALGHDSDQLIDRSFEKMFAYKLWIHKDLERAIGCLGKHGKLLTVQHHISHAASAFYPSPFEKAVILTVDGVGEWTTTAIGIGEGNKINLCETIKYPHSLGLLYSAFTYFCGFKVNSGDYKFMGLAPYGKPRYYELIKENIIDIKQDGSYRLNLSYFDFYRGGTMINEDMFSKLFQGKKRLPESRITQREMDIAASVQKITEEIIISFALHAKEKYGKNIENLVIAGGVGLNCVANGKLQNEKIFKNIWIQPAAGDAGGALGAALYAYYAYFNNMRIVNANDSQKGSLLGPSYSNKEIYSWLDDRNIPYTILKESERAEKIADLLTENNVIGLFQGRMEFGPRALGNRSIIAGCLSSDMQSHINLKIKYRESFRPFAPIVLEEKSNEYFDLCSNSPYMLKVGKVRETRRTEFDIEKLLQEYGEDMLKVISMPRSDIPAITHVDYSARIQTVNKDTNSKLYDILHEYEKKTGYAILVNTSFNVRGDPIVCSLRDAYTCFMRTGMDVLILENAILYKDKQPEFADEGDWRDMYELD